MASHQHAIDSSTRDHVRKALLAKGHTNALLAGLRPSAVLIALFETGQGPHLWLIRRTEDGTAHSGQVALPGGKKDARDGSLEATALREAHEEMGLCPHNVQVLGRLDDYVTITGFRISPFVGWIEEPFEPKADPREVARVFCAPLCAFHGPGGRHEVQWGSFRRVVRAYLIHNEVVWGATATILQRFARLVRL